MKILALMAAFSVGAGLLTWGAVRIKTNWERQRIIQSSYDAVMDAAQDKDYLRAYENAQVFLGSEECEVAGAACRSILRAYVWAAARQIVSLVHRGDLQAADGIRAAVTARLQSRGEVAGCAPDLSFMVHKYERMANRDGAYAGFVAAARGQDAVAAIENGMAFIEHHQAEDADPRLERIMPVLQEAVLREVSGQDGGLEILERLNRAVVDAGGAGPDLKALTAQVELRRVLRQRNETYAVLIQEAEYGRWIDAAKAFLLASKDEPRDPRRAKVAAMVRSRGLAEVVRLMEEHRQEQAQRLLNDL